LPAGEIGNIGYVAVCVQVSKSLLNCKCLPSGEMGLAVSVPAAWLINRGAAAPFFLF